MDEGSDVTDSMRASTIQRTIGDGHDLASPRFAGDSRLEACYDDEARLTLGATGDSVTKVQQGLTDLGYDLGPAGADGIYGRRTWNAVKAFKSDQVLGWEHMGDVGPGSMRRLDELFPRTGDPGGGELPPCPQGVDGGDTFTLAADDDETTPRPPSLAIPGVTCQTTPPSDFTDAISVKVIEVPVPVKQNAAEWDTNLHARFGAEGGRTQATPGPVTTTLNGDRVIGAKSTCLITETVPVAFPVPGSAITKPDAVAELAAINALAARIRQHEDKHAEIERKGRTGFAASLKGRKDSDVDGAIKSMECKIGAQQRELDNKEGKLTLDSSNKITASGVDHPEYVQGCGPQP